MSVLEELWYGNLEPSEYSFSSSREYKELLHLVSSNEEKLLSTMTQEQKELFSRYSDCIREFQSLAELLLFLHMAILSGQRGHNPGPLRAIIGGQPKT